MGTNKCKPLLYGLRSWGNSLHDADAGVRQHAITVLAHLVLNDMMKVKAGAYTRPLFGSS